MKTGSKKHDLKGFPRARRLFFYAPPSDDADDADDAHLHSLFLALLAPPSPSQNILPPWSRRRAPPSRRGRCTHPRRSRSSRCCTSGWRPRRAKKARRARSPLRRRGAARQASSFWWCFSFFEGFVSLVDALLSRTRGRKKRREQRDKKKKEGETREETSLSRGESVAENEE